MRRKSPASYAVTSQKLEVDAEMVVQGILESIETCKKSGIGNWQRQAIHRGYELLGRQLGLFHDKVDIGTDDKIIEQLIRGRRRAAGMPEDEDREEEEPQDDSSAEPKPN